MKEKIINARWGYADKLGKVFEAKRFNDQYKCFTDCSNFYANKEDAEVVQEVEKSCESCGWTGCWDSTVKECIEKEREYWKPIEPAEEKSCDTCKFMINDICKVGKTCNYPNNDFNSWQPIELAEKNKSILFTEKCPKGIFKVAGVGIDAPTTGTAEDDIDYQTKYEYLSIEIKDQISYLKPWSSKEDMINALNAIDKAVNDD